MEKKTRAETFTEITKSVIQLVQWSGVMQEFRRQIKVAYRDAHKLPAGGGPIRLSGNYLILALVHDKWGGMLGAKKIITDELGAQRPEEYDVIYWPENCEILLENVKADLNQKGLLSRQDSKTKRQKISKKEANTKAREILEKDFDINIRDLAGKIPCSIGLASKLPAWKAVQQERKKGRKPKKKRLTPKMLKVAGTGKKDEILKLVIEQEDDRKGDESQPKLHINPKKERPQIRE